MSNIKTKSQTQSRYNKIPTFPHLVSHNGLVWMQSLLSELRSRLILQLSFVTTRVLVLSNYNSVLHSWMKHIELELYFVREMAQARGLTVVNVPAHNQLADTLITSLYKQKKLSVFLLPAFKQ